MQRVVVVGTSGSGKTTMARAVAAHLGVPHVELDAVHWKPNWTSTQAEEMLPIVDRLTREGGWAVDGNYLKLRELIWSRADTLIWLDYPMSVVCSRVVRRTFGRWWRQEVLWNGNRESVRTQLFDRDSLFLWVIQTWRKHRSEYPKMLRGKKYRHLRVLRFRSPREADRWLETLTRT